MAQDVEGLLIRLDATSAQLQRQLRRAERTVSGSSKKMEREIQRVDKAMDRLNTMASTVRRTLGTLGVGISLQGIRSMTTGALQAADAIRQTAERVGVSVEALQELRYAASLVNVQSGTLDMALQRLTRRLGSAAEGSGALAKNLEDFGISVRDEVTGQIRDTEEILMDLAEAVANSDSNAEQLLATFNAFDSEGAPMVNLLRRGRQGLAEARREAHEFGLVLRDDVVRAASDTNTQLSTLFQTIRAQINEGLLEALTQDATDLSAVARDPQFHSGLQAIGEGIGAIGQAVMDSIGQLGNFVALLRDPSWVNLGNLLRGSTLGLAAGAAEGLLGGDKGVARAQQLAGINDRMAETRETIAALERSGIENAEMRLKQERETLRELERQRNEIMAQLDGSAEALLGGGAVVLPGIRVTDDPPGSGSGQPPGTGTGTTIDTQAQAALAAMQQAAAVRDAHADAVGALLTGLRQEAEMNELTLRYLHDQSGELEVQQRLLEIRQQLGAEAAAEAEPVLRHIQEQTNAIERQTNAYQVLNTSAERAFDRIGGAMTRMFMEGEDAAITWHNTVNAVLSEIMQTMLQLALINPFKNALFGGNAATLGDVGGILGEIFHSGGIVGGPAATRMVNPLVFAGAPRMHSGGIAGDEVPAILRRGEEVLPANHPRHRNNAGGDVNVTIPVSITNNAPVQVRTRQSQAPGGGRQLEILVDELNARNIGSPGTASNKAIRTGFGAQPLLTSRG